MLQPAKLACIVLRGRQPFLQATAVDKSHLYKIRFNMNIEHTKPTDPEQLQGDRRDSATSPSWQILQKMPEPEV